MLKKTYSSDEEKEIFEAHIGLDLERCLQNDFVNYRDLSRFSPITFAEFVSACTSKDRDTSMTKDGIFHYATDRQGRPYFVDCVSGLILCQEGKKFSIAKGACTSKEYDIFDAAYLRQYIAHPEIRKQRLIISDPQGWGGEITTLSYLGLDLKDIFLTPILEYTISTVAELEQCVQNISSILSESKFFSKLWFRGQRKEYTLTRSQDVIRKLGLPCEYGSIPSLIPSAGRITETDQYKAIRKEQLYWGAAFKIWLISQTDRFKSQFSIDAPMYMDLIQNLEADKMGVLLVDCPYDIEDIFFAEDRLANILATQQYGGCASMLDITDDLDVAIFFCQSYLNSETRKYELCGPSSENVIYLLASTRESSTVNISNHAFQSIEFDEEYPLPPRITNQHCGLLMGADMFSRNTYSYRIVAKIKFSGNHIETTKTVDEMFPGPEIDSLYKTYSYAIPKLTGLYG